MSDLTARLTHVLQDWSTRSLYVGDQSEFRANTKLNLVTNRICFNSFTQFGKQYNLPTTDGYFIYSFTHQLTRGHTVSIGGCCNAKWMNGLDYLNNYQTRLFVYDNYGKLIPLSKMYILSVCDRCYLVIEKDTLQNCVSEGIDGINNVFLTYWVNPHPDNAISGKEWSPTFNNRTGKWTTDVASASAAINAITDTDHTFTWVIVNGTIINPSSFQLGVTDYVSIIKETDIFCKFTVPIDDNVTGYESTLYQDYREILHMPKALNPNNYILPHDLLDVIVRDADTERGLLQSRYDYRSVRQITHQDYSVDRTDADSLRDALHATEITAQVIVRNPNTKHILGGDVNYIEDLYRNDDDTIVALLRDSKVNGVDFWAASNLEQSDYLSLIFTNTAKSQPSDSGTLPDLNYYLNALGFFNTANVLDGGVELGAWKDSTMLATIPDILLGRSLQSYVFCNGRKIRDSDITTYNYGNNKLAINVKDSNIKDGDRISVLLKDFGGSSVVTQEVSENNSTYTMPVSNAFLYTVSNGKFSTLSKSASTFRTDTLNGQTVITFYKQMYGQTVYIVPEDAVGKNSISIDSDLQSRNTLVYPLVDSNNNPVLYYQTLDVFLNGYWCIAGVDYTVFTDDNGYLNIAISNSSYLDLENSGNLIEWYAYADVEISDDFDYLDNGILRYTKNSYLFEKNISEVYTEGRYIVSPVNEGSYLTVSGSAQGSIGEHVLRFPYVLMKALPETARQSDEDRRVAISKYFKDSAPQKPAQVFLTKQHHVYSPWLQGIISRLADGRIVGVNDPDPAMFIKQFPTLGGLRDIDPALKRKGRIDTDYIAVAATYTLEFPEIEVDVRTIVQKLINLTLVRDLSSLGVTPV